MPRDSPAAAARPGCSATYPHQGLAEYVGRRTLCALAIGSNAVNANDMIREFLAFDALHGSEKLAPAEGACRQEDINLLIDDGDLGVKGDVKPFAQIKTNNSLFLRLQIFVNLADLREVSNHFQRSRWAMATSIEEHRM